MKRLTPGYSKNRMLPFQNKGRRLTYEDRKPPAIGCHRRLLGYLLSAAAPCWTIPKGDDRWQTGNQVGSAAHSRRPAGFSGRLGYRHTHTVGTSRRIRRQGV